VSSVVRFPAARALSSHPVDVGFRSEAAIAYRLFELGYDVYLPGNPNTRVDMFVDTADGILRCQCKTGRLRSGTVRFSTQSVRCNTKQILTRGYVGEIDWFLVYCPDTDGVYAVAIEDACRSSGSLRVTPALNNQQRGIQWAADYQLPRPVADRDAA
jgi:hypothetical protein